MTHWARMGYFFLAWLFLVGVLLQVFLAGLSLFGTPSYWPIHRQFGWLFFGLVGLTMLVLVFLSRLPRRTIGLTALLLLLVGVQQHLPMLRRIAPAVAALHPVNAMLVFWVAVTVARRARALVQLHWGPLVLHNDSGFRPGT